MNINTLTTWVQILSIAVGPVASLVSVWRHQRDKLDPSVDPLRWRRNAAMLIYGLSAILAAFYMINQSRPVNNLGDLAAWVFVFFALSVLLWFVSVLLGMRFLDKRS